MTATLEREADQAAPPQRRGMDPRLGWVLVGLLTLLVLATWAPSLGEALGDNHEGRILARHALHVVNAEEKGLAGSGWLTDASPYTTSYSHHPPLLNFGYYLTAKLLPVDTDVAMRVFAYLLGAAMIPVGAAVLRRLGFGFAPILLAAGAVAVTPLFFSYARLHGNVTLLLAMALVAVRLREDRPIPTRELVVGTLVAMAAIIAGYLGLAAGALLGLWVFAKRRFDRVTLVLGLGMALGAAITALYVIGSTGAGDLSDQLALRSVGGEFTTERFHERMLQWRESLAQDWWRQALAPIALVAGLLDRRTRVPVLILGVVAVGYVYGLRQGAYVHDYWIFPLLLPIWLGIAALAATMTEHAPRWLAGTLVVLAGGALMFPANDLLTGEIPPVYFHDREAAGNLVRDSSPPADGQVAAWGLGVPSPRWMSLYWDLPFRAVNEQSLGEIRSADLVLVRIDRLPDWIDDRDGLARDAEHRASDYLLVTGEGLRRAADDEVVSAAEAHADAPAVAP